MDIFSLGYREVIPDLSNQDEWIDITLNTGGTQSTLEDIKVKEKAGGYCYKNIEQNYNRNRYILWRTYQDVLELSEISLDFNLYQNNVRYKFSDSPVIWVSIIEQERYMTILVITVSSLHRISFPHPDTLSDVVSLAGSSGGLSGSGSNSTELIDSQSFSIFREANSAIARDPSSFHVIDMQSGSSSYPIPHTAAAHLSSNGEHSYFALACQSQLMLYTMNSSTGHTTLQQLKENNIMPRLFSNLKGALTGKSDAIDADNVTALTFNNVNGTIFLLVLYRNDYLRVWTITNPQIVCSLNCSREGKVQLLPGPQGNALRKISERSVCVFVSHSTSSEFVCIDINTDSGNSSGISLMRRKLISAPPLDLVDYDVSATRIWALWSNAEGEFTVSNYPLVRGMGMNWVSAAMEPPPDRYCVGIEQGTDPRKAYCSYIFHPGKFERSVIAKALYMFRRSNVRFDSKYCTMLMLKENVCQAVDDEIHNEIKDFELSDDEYTEIATRLWERFYSCCEQYHMKAYQPTGLVILEAIDAVCVVKKSTFSLLRPCETLEHLMLAGDDVDIDVVVPMHFHGNEREGEDLVNLIAIIAQLEKWLPEDVKMDFDKKLYQLEIPNILVSTLTDEILSGDPDKEILPRNFLVIIRQKLQSINDLRTPFSMLLNSLSMDYGNPHATQTHIDIAESSRFFMSVGTLFGSHIGISLLSETVRQTALIRFAICRNLLILQQILIESSLLSVEVAEALRSQYMPDIGFYLQSYYVMVWISETPVNMNAALALETSMQRLNLLQLNTGFGRISSNSGKCHAAPLLRVFLTSKGLYTALSLFAKNFKTLTDSNWQNTLMPLTTIVCQLIWTISLNFEFGEWLFGTCQHIIIQDYVRLLKPWCEWNIYSRQFILAVSLLDSGETLKAYEMFLQAAKGASKEQFLSEKLLKNTLIPHDDDMGENYSISSNKVIAQYYLKVINLFEQHNALDSVIAMAQVVIGLLEKSDPQLPMFQSIVFNSHLRLEHYEEAYHSLIYNADLSRRKDCLRQLVVTLFDRKRLDLLMHFPYVGLHEEFENIVEQRARSLSIVDEKNEIYDFLYAFHVNNGNMRKASAVMYEQAMRYKAEGDTLNSMEKRCDSLLMCINALHLIDTRYRWIAKPMMGDEATACNGNQTVEDVEIIEPISSAQQVVVLEIKDIHREYLQTEALITLAQKRSDINSYINAGPKELAFIMVSSGLFTAALKIAKGFDITLLPIFEGLTAACVHAVDENENEAWNWLQENNTADLPHCNRATHMAWSLLQKLVEENEEEESTQIRKSVVNKLLGMNAFVPQWLYNDYKRLNCSELLYLYVKHSRLLEAAELAQEMISAMLGAGCEYFSFKHAIMVTNPLMCMPVQTIDLLLHGLKLNSSQDIEYKQAALQLEELVQRYIDTALRTAEDKVDMETQAQHQRRQMRI